MSALWKLLASSYQQTDSLSDTSSTSNFDSPPFETHTRILHLLRATNMKKAILVLQSSEWIQHIATAFTKAITSHKIYFLFWGPGSQTGYFLPFTYLIRSCCSSGFLDCLYLSEISFPISPRVCHAFQTTSH